MTLDSKALEAAHESYSTHGQTGDLRRQRISDDLMSAVITAYLSTILSGDAGELVVHLRGTPTDNECVRVVMDDAAAAITSLSARIGALEAENERLRQSLASEERRSEELVKRLDKARAGNGPDFCYNPHDWEFTCAWDDRDQVHAYGDALPLGAVMQVDTLICGPRRWVAHIPVSWSDDGDPEDTYVEWFDSEEAATAALSRRATTGGGENG